MSWLGDNLGTVGGAVGGGLAFGALGAIGGGLIGNSLIDQPKQQAQQNVEMGQQLMANAPRPGAISYNPTYNPSTMSTLSMANPNTQGLDAFRTNALRTGPSNAANMQMNQQQMMQTQGRNQAARDVAGSSATARSQLAMRGGLTGGASERVAKSGKSNLLNADQNLQTSKMNNAANIGIQDENSRVNQLAMLPGMENQALQLPLQAKEFDVGNQMQSNQGQNAFNLGQYQAQMKAFENAQQANAMLNSNNSGGFLSGIFG